MRGTTRNTAPVLRRAGLTLYEVVLSMAIFLIAMAALSQLISVGSQASGNAQLQTQAALYAESKMSEVTSGVIPMEATDPQPLFPEDTSWQWMLTEGESPADGLKDLTVTVMHLGVDSQVDLTFSVRRYVRDPQVFLDAAAEQQQSSSTSSMNSSGSGSP